MAFDQQRNRIGHGKGYYDRFMQSYMEVARTKSWPVPKTIGIALKEQVWPEQLPWYKHDRC